jgi:hypothetical protein
MQMEKAIEHRIALQYLEEPGTNNPAAELKWLLLAANYGHVPAQTWVALLYSSNTVTIKIFGFSVGFLNSRRTSASRPDDNCNSATSGRSLLHREDEAGPSCLVISGRVDEFWTTAIGLGFCQRPQWTSASTTPTFTTLRRSVCPRVIPTVPVADASGARKAGRDEARRQDTLARIANAGAIKVLDPICYPSVRSAHCWFAKWILFSVRVGAE